MGDEVPTFKCILLGDGGTGKTSFVQRHLTGEFDKHYIATVGVDVNQLIINTNRGLIKLNLWDTAGQLKNSGLRDGYYVQGHCALIMFDVTSKISYRSVPNYYSDIRRVCQEIPIVLCGNKVDVKERIVKPKHINFHKRKGIQYYDISTRSNYNSDKPILWLARKVMGDSTLEIRAMPAFNIPILPPIQEAALRDRLMDDFREAENISLSETDNEELSDLD